MSDLISREDAINAVAVAVLADKDEIEAIKAIPSVQVNGDFISRQDAIEAVCGNCEGESYPKCNQTQYCEEVKALLSLPSADAVSMEEHIKELNDLAVEWKAKFAKAEKITDEIYDETMAKVAKECEECKERLRNIRPSAEAESDDLVIKGAKGIQDGLYNIKDGKLFKYKANGGTVRTYPIVPSADAVEVDRTSEWVAVRREEYEDLIAEAVQGEWGHMIADGADGSHWYEYECSHCGEVVLRPYNFCPNCGARMKGGDDE